MGIPNVSQAVSVVNDVKIVHKRLRIMSLRQYQIDLIEQIRYGLREHRRILAVLPTGAGKTHTFCTIAQLSTQRNNNVLILVHRSELLQQTSARLTVMGVEHGIIAPKHPTKHAQVQLASINSAARRLSQFPWSPNLVIVDEAHHCAARSWQKVLEGYPNAIIIGWTATPARLDGKGLSSAFDGLVEGPSISRLIGQGYLSRYRLFAPPNQIDRSAFRRRGGDFRTEEIDQVACQPREIAAAVLNYRQYAAGKQAIAFCGSIRHAQTVRNAFVEAGIPAVDIDGTLSAAERTTRIEAFKSGAIKILVSVDLISEGFDVPGCECVLLLRPTASLSIYLQQVGRALRPSDGEAIVLDCAGNAIEHGLPCQLRQWSLKDTIKSRDMDQVAVPIRVCEKCFAVYRPAPSCPHCGHTPESKRELPKEVDQVLVEIDVRAAAAAERAEKKKRKVEVGKARTLEELLKIAEDRGYKPGWAHAVMKSRK